MAFIKKGSAVVTRPVVNIQQHITQRKIASAPSALIDLSEFPSDKFLFTQCTIMGAIDLEKNGFYIKQGFEPLVNMNGDGWPIDVVLKTFHTYRGAFNFYNHVQIESQSKGTVIDAYPRWVTLPNGSKTVYVEIIVATNRKHATLCKEIETGMLNTMSLGAIVKYSRCSKCGHVSTTGNDYCNHLLNERRQSFTDENGIERIIGEICGNSEDVDSNRFIEASWVSDPAFYGAVKRHVLTPVLQHVETGKAQVLPVKRLITVGPKPQYEELGEARIAKVASKYAR